MAEPKRRKLHLEEFDSVLEECHRLLQSGYRKTGNWSLAQVCQHIRLTIDSSVAGYPLWMKLFAPLRPILRMMFLSRLLRGDSPAGLPTAPSYVPRGDLVDAEELKLLEQAIENFRSHEGAFHAHPGFGLNDREALERFHSVHTAHHLSFLLPEGGG